MIHSVEKWGSVDREAAYLDTTAPFGIIPYCWKTLSYYLSKWGRTLINASTYSLRYSVRLVVTAMSDYINEREINRLYATSSLRTTVDNFNRAAANFNAERQRVVDALL